MVARERNAAERVQYHLSLEVQVEKPSRLRANHLFYCWLYLCYLALSNLSEISKPFSLESMYKTVSSSKQYKANLPCIEHPASIHMEFVSGFSSI